MTNKSLRDEVEKVLDALGSCCCRLCRQQATDRILEIISREIKRYYQQGKQDGGQELLLAEEQVKSMPPIKSYKATIHIDKETTNES